MRQKILHQILNLSQLSGRVEQSRRKLNVCFVLHALYGVTKLTSYNLVSEPKKKIQIVQKCNWRRSRSFLAMETEPQAIVSSAHHRSLPFFLFNTKPELEPTFSSAPRNAFFRSREREVEVDIVQYFFTETIYCGWIRTRDLCPRCMVRYQ